jgi:gamma-glutamyl-gamma-aminobutyrate hydrolase PuuD
VSGRAPEDGLVEAVELLDKRFALGVLWHPEEDAASGVIGALVRAAAAPAGDGAVALPQASD